MLQYIIFHLQLAPSFSSIIENLAYFCPTFSKLLVLLLSYFFCDCALDALSAYLGLGYVAQCEISVTSGTSFSILFAC